MHHRFIALCISLLCATTAVPTQAAVSVSIGINVPAYPQMVVVPGYPVYYAPGLGANFFFYDGMYWVLEGDYWYMSSWYNGPWVIVEPAYVPYYVLRVPVRYYMAPPPYFRGWQPGAPPRWGHHWGPQWERQHRDWDRRPSHAAPGPAPLPTYQRRYSGDRYPSPAQQADLQSRNYRYQPRTEVARVHAQEQGEQRRGPMAAEQQRPQREPPQVQRGPQRAPQMAQEMPPQYQQERPEHRGGGPQRHEAGPRMQPQPMPPQQPPMAMPNAPQHQQQSRPEPQQQERGHGRKRDDEGRDKRDQGGPPGR